MEDHTDEKSFKSVNSHLTSSISIDLPFYVEKMNEAETPTRVKALKNSYSGQVIGVFTSGGDAQGMNAAIRAIARMGIYLGCRVYFIHEGYEGMVDGSSSMFQEAQWEHVSGMIDLGGTFIGSARCKSFRERSGRLKAAKNLIKHSITHLVCIGGDGSLTGANTFREEWTSLVAELLEKGEITDLEAESCKCLHIVGLVGSIDNDFCGTDMTIGADSALHRIVEAIDAISTTASSHMRCFVLEVMGRRCGYLALMTAMGSDADWLFIPEYPAQEGWEDAMCSKLKLTRSMGQRLNIIIVAEGATDFAGKPITSEQIRKIVVDRLNYDTRVTVLGHVQRGGAPSAFDRLLATRMGAEAVLALMESDVNSPPVVISLAGNQAVRVPLTACVEKTKAAGKAMDEHDYKKAVLLRGRTFQRNLEMYIQLSKLHPKPMSTSRQFNIAILNVGAPACGENACVRSVVRYVLCEGHKPLCVYDGWIGLTKDRVRPFEWMSVAFWTSSGGSKLGTQKVDAKTAGFAKIAEKIRKYKIHAFIVIGGFEGFASVLQMFEQRENFQEFCIPMILIPVTISNNIPGTDFSIGCDTALNEIMTMCDKMKLSAQGSKRRVFIVETMGGYCGYLATIAAVTCGADQAYIYEEPFTINDIVEDAQHLKLKMAGEMKRGMVLRNEKANENFSTDFILRLFSEHGRGVFSSRANILGHQQQGGYPSPFDRSFATRLGAKAVSTCTNWIEEYCDDEGHVYTMHEETACVLGLSKRSMSFTPVARLKQETDFVHRLPKEQWWLKLRPLLRILAKHESVYVADLNED